MYEYMAVTNGVANGFSPILVAFFRTFPGFTAAIYAAFSVVEFAGRTVGSAVQYRLKLPDKKKYGFVFFVYQVYEVMDMCLLWLPYPLMLVNRAICGFLGSNSAHSAKLRRSALHPRKTPLARQRLKQRASHRRGERFSLLMGFLGKCSTIAGASHSAAQSPCWPVISSSGAGSGTFERCMRRAAAGSKTGADTEENASQIKWTPPFSAEKRPYDGHTDSVWNRRSKNEPYAAALAAFLACSLRKPKSARKSAMPTMENNLLAVIVSTITPR